MSKKNFNFGDLIAPETENTKKNIDSKPRKKPGPKKKEEPMTQHAFRISDEIWADFEWYIKLEGGVQNTVVNNVLRQVIEQNKERIEQYKSLMS